MSSEIRLHPVGAVEHQNGRFFLSVLDEYREALTALKDFSHVNVLWWGSHSDSTGLRETLTVARPYRNSPDTVGIFATRSEIRPNPVLITTAQVLGIDVTGGRVELAWIDAAPGSPVIDIKPYLPCADRVREVRLPAWCSGWPGDYEDSASFDWSAVFRFD